MRKACRQRDERAHDRQHAAEEDSLEAVLVEPVLRDIDMRLLDEEVMAVAVDETASAVMTDEIGKDRADHAADHARRQGACKCQLPREDQITRKAEDELTGDWDTGILRSHEDGNREVPPRGNELQEHRRKLFHVCKSSFLFIDISNYTHYTSQSGKYKENGHANTPWNALCSRPTTPKNRKIPADR